MNERLWLIFTEGGFIGTTIILENDNNVYSLVDLFGYFEDQGIVYLESEIHQKYSFVKPKEDNEVLEESIQKCIPSYLNNKLTYHWSMIIPSQYDTHPQEK